MTKEPARPPIGLAILGAATMVLFVVALYMIFAVAPVERQMGIVQKIFYFHVPSAYCMYLGAVACFVGSVGYLVKGSDFWDALGRAGGELAVAFGFIVLTTGPLWGAKAWGHYWTWDPRLTTCLLSVMIYVAYSMLRNFTGDGPQERRFASGLGILGAFNLPIIHYSVQKWGGQHPTVITQKGGGLQHPAMTQSLTLTFIAFTLFAVLLIWARVSYELARAKLERLEEDAIDLGIDDRMET